MTPTRRGLALAVLAASALSFSLLQTIVAPALPAMQREFGTSASTATWILTAYVLSACVATPIVGRLGDMFGKNRMLLFVLSLLACGTLVAALATSIEMMIIARAIQGVGGAVFPLSIGIVRDEFPRDRVAGAIGLISATFGIGAAFALVLGGLIVDHLGFAAMFWLCLVLIVVAAVAAWFCVSESQAGPRTPIDWWGAALLGGGLSCGLLAVSQGNVWGWTSAPTLALLAGSVTLLAAWRGFELRVAAPMVDMRMLRLRGVWAANLAGILVGFGMYGSFVLVPQLAQLPKATGYGFGASVTQSGLYVLPTAVMILVAGVMMGWISLRFSARASVILGNGLIAAAFVQLTFWHSSEWHLYLSSVIIGVGIGLTFAAMTTVIVQAVAQAQTGIATGMNSIARMAGGALGAQVTASLLSAHTDLTDTPAESGFVLGFLACAVALTIAAGVATLIPRRLVEMVVPPGHRRLGEVAVNA